MPRTKAQHRLAKAARAAAAGAEIVKLVVEGDTEAPETFRVKDGQHRLSTLKLEPLPAPAAPLPEHSLAQSALDGSYATNTTVRRSYTKSSTNVVPPSKQGEAPLPEVDLDLAFRIEEFLATKYNSRRPPIIVAQLLALIIQLHRTNEEFPARRRVAIALDCSMFTIDGALSQAMARGLLTTHTDTTYSTRMENSGKREGIVRHRWYTPTPSFLKAVAPPRPAARVA